MINRSRIEGQMSTAKNYQISFMKKFNDLCKDLIEQCKFYVELADNCF